MVNKSILYVGPDRMPAQDMREAYSIAAKLLKKELGDSICIYKARKSTIPLKRLEYRPNKDKVLKLVVYDPSEKYGRNLRMDFTVCGDFWPNPYYKGGAI